MDDSVPEGATSPPRKKARIVKAPSMASAAPAVPESTSPTSIDSAVGDGDGDMPIDPGGTELDRSELVRLITQSLKTLGYGESATQLEAESKIECEPSETTAFKNAVLGGDWPQAMALLDSLQILPEKLKAVKFELLEQKYLELLEARQLKDALFCLREEISPLEHEVDRLHTLSGLVMCADVAAIRKELRWTGTGSGSRMALLRKIEPMIPTSVLVPERRLEKLLQQALEFQRQSNLYHNTPDRHISLLMDYRCTPDAIPRHSAAVLRHHKDEVWFIAFSPSGQWLASASKDGTAAIWDVATRSVKHELVGHTDAVGFLAWSPDDTCLLTCGNEDDHSIKLWETATGKCLSTFNKHREGVTACAWSADGRCFVSGSTDQDMHLWSVDGALLHTWTRVRTSDMSMSPDGVWLVVACHAKKIRLFNLDTKAEQCLEESGSITSLSLSADGKSALVNLSSEEIHVWDLASKQVLHKYHGHKQGKYAIRSCFGGYQDAFVVSGSEDNCVYLWHRRSQTLLETLEGHTRSVNSVAWHPTNCKLLASASDDKTIRLWGVDPKVIEGGFRGPLMIKGSDGTTDAPLLTSAAAAVLGPDIAASTMC